MNFIFIIIIIIKIKNFTYFNLRKYLAVALFLSKIDYCDIVYKFYPLLDFLLKRL